MRVTCENVDEFIECIEAEFLVGGAVFQNAVRVNISHRPADGNARSSVVLFDVVLQASAVMIVKDGSQYLLECGVGCGRDYNDSTEDKSGSDLAQVRKEKIESFAKRYDLRVLPGVIDF